MREGPPNDSEHSQSPGVAGSTDDAPLRLAVAAPALREIGAWRVLLAIVVYILAFYLHGRLGQPLA